MAFSGLCLALHFSCWIWGLKHTSLIHAYLFVSVTPLVIAVGTLVLRKPISTGELAGECRQPGGRLLPVGRTRDRQS